MTIRKCKNCGSMYDEEIYGDLCPLCSATNVKSTNIPGLEPVISTNIPELDPVIKPQFTTHGSSPRCIKCGFPLDIGINGRKWCPKCGFNGNKVIIEETDNVGNTTIITRLLSEGDNYYEYDPNSSPFREDAWGMYYLGKCYSKSDSRLLKEVVICANAPRWYVNSMWKLLKSTHFLEITQKVFIPIIDLVDDGRFCYLVEEYFDGVSLFDLMHGQVRGVDGQQFEFATKMYNLYLNNRTGFAKHVIKEILRGINLIHDNGIPIIYIELPENIIFTKNGEIRIRMISSLFYNCEKHFTIISWVYDALFPQEYNSPEYYNDYGRHIDERSEIFTIGIFTYSIITGHLPNKEKTSLEDCHCVHGPILDPRDENYVDKPYIGLNYDRFFLDEIEDIHLKAIIEKATKQNPNERFQSATEFINALDCSDQTLQISPISVTAPWYKKHFSPNLSEYITFSTHFYAFLHKIGLKSKKYV